MQTANMIYKQISFKRMTSATRRHSSARGAKYGWISSIGVLKPHRKTGIGTRLILQGMHFLKDNGMTTAMLSVDDWNETKAKQLYENVGFKMIWRVSFYEKKLA